MFGSKLNNRNAFLCHHFDTTVSLQEVRKTTHGGDGVLAQESACLAV